MESEYPVRISAELGTGSRLCGLTWHPSGQPTGSTKSNGRRITCAIPLQRGATGGRPLRELRDQRCHGEYARERVSPSAELRHRPDAKPAPNREQLQI